MVWGLEFKVWGVVTQTARTPRPTVIRQGGEGIWLSKYENTLVATIRVCVPASK